MATCVQRSPAKGGSSTTASRSVKAGLSFGPSPSGFHTSRSPNTPSRNCRGFSAVKSTQIAASLYAASVICIGSQKPGSRSVAGSRLSQNETVPLQPSGE